MGLKGLPNVLDIRAVGLTVGIDLASKPDARRQTRLTRCWKARFHEHDLMLRAVGDTLALSPPLIVSEARSARSSTRSARSSRRCRT